MENISCDVQSEMVCRHYLRHISLDDMRLVMLKFATCTRDIK